MIAAIFALFGLALADSQEQEQDRIRSQQASHNEHTPSSQFATPKAGVPAFAERFVSNPEPDNADERDKRDLAAQEAMSVWTFWMTLFSGATVVITGFGTLFIWEQVRLTREAVKDTGDATKAMLEQNQLARENLEAFHASERGYCTLHMLGGEESNTSNTVHYTVQLENTGRSAIKILQIRCGPLQHPAYPSDGAFHGGAFEEFEIKSGEASNQSPLVKGTKDVRAFPYIGGYVEYRCKFGRLHRTHFCYSVLARQFDGLVHARFTHLVENVKRERGWPPDT